MKKNAVRYQFVEHLSRLGDASTHQVGDPHYGLAQEYHFHHTLEVIIIKQGWVEGVVGGVMGTLQKDTLLVIGNDMAHGVLRTSDDCQVILVHVPSELLRWDDRRFPELAHGLEYIRNSKSGMVYTDVQLARQATRLAVKIASADGFLRLSFVMHLLHLLSSTPPQSTLLAERPQAICTKQADESPIDRAYRYLYAHFREEIPLSLLAAYAGQNPSALCRSFKKSSGYTIGQFCTRLRIEYACNLLLTTDIDISQIAYQSGYNSYPHFCIQFKQVMKMSPTTYRIKTLPR